MILFFFIIPTIVVLLVIFPNLIPALQKKDIRIVLLIIVVGIGVASIPWLYLNHQINKENKIALQK
ncbi:MAG: hypothetical protein A3C44_04400 [Gammaproteobacteria bacterium RIFCSPHIGHO2_02_FULL_39_13]|nr:MAG: hypothetical protein A3C44_04400 [Gammaproteobacteria bacterium RIFCSPHIGHO2_02_FULL_39_13]